MKHNGFSIPIIAGVGIDHLTERENWLKELVKKTHHHFFDKVFLDVGVNIGQTILKVMSFNPKQKYIGFEPNYNCLHYTSELVKANLFENVILVPAALGNKHDMVDLQLYEDSNIDSSASIIRDFREAKTFSRQKIVLFNGDDYEFKESVGFIKIDVEGSELEVLIGLLKLIRRDQPLIICEILPSSDIPSRIERQQKIEFFLKEINYKIHLIEKTGTVKSIKSFEIHSDIDMVNYLFTPMSFEL